MTYRTAIVGARRGLYHARAYQGIENMKVIALCEVDAERLAQGVKELNVLGYRDYGEMLKKAQPDIVHAVTGPNIPRSVWVEPAAENGVQALVIEKPIAMLPSEAQALSEAQRRTGLKIVVNHQRRYMPFAGKMLELINNGKLGRVHFVRASTQGEVMDMATHMIDLVLLPLRDVVPSSVWAVVQGRETYANQSLMCPEDLFAVYTFPGGERAFFESARRAFGTADFPTHKQFEPWMPPRCNIDVWGEKGRFWWREYGEWGYSVEGDPQTHSWETDFRVDDVGAQRAFTQAIATWLDDASRPHLCRLEVAKTGFDSIMAAYHSALLGVRLRLPSSFTDEDWRRLREKVTGSG